MSCRCLGSRDHQASHRATHKKACNAVKKAKGHLDTEEQSLRSHPPDMFLPANVFEEAVGHFWGIHETRPYMRARYGYIDALTKIKTRSAVQVAYDNTRDMLRLCRGDNMGVRDLIPSLLLRLGRDQDCYDFVKWYAQVRSDYDWGDMDLPYLDVKDADVLENVERFIRAYSPVCETVAVTLIKIRLFLELRTLKDSQMIGEKVPREILDNVQDQLLSHALKIHPLKKQILEADDEDYKDRIASIKYHIFQLHEAVRKANRYFWPALLEPGKHLTAPPSPYSSGSVQEMQLYLQYSYDSWAETPGAIEMIKQLEKGQFLEDGFEFYDLDPEVHGARA